MKDIEYGIDQLHEYRKTSQKQTLKHKPSRSEYMFFIITIVLFEVFIFICSLLTRR